MVHYQTTQMFPWPGKLPLMRAAIERQRDASGAELDLRNLDLRLETKRRVLHARPQRKATRGQSREPEPRRDHRPSSARTILDRRWRGLWCAQRSQFDALPELSDPQVIIATEWMGRSPTIIENQITYPITTTFLGAPKVKTVRGFTMFGMSFVYLVFQDGTDIYWARSRVVEYLAKVRDRLPEGVTPQIGPDATSVGWVFQYALVDESGTHDLQELRSFQDWNLRYWLQGLEGVAEVASVGGFEGEEGRLFRPLALAKTFSMAFASVFAITLVPALMVSFLKGKITPEEKNPVNRICIASYRPLLRLCLRGRYIVIALVLAITGATLIPMSRLGLETVEKIVAELDERTKMPGVQGAWTMPTKARIDMLSTGIRTPIGVKVFGPDLEVITKINDELERVLRPLPSTRSVYAERELGGFFLDVTPDREAIARYGLDVRQVLDVVESTIGGMDADTTFEGRERYRINVRYPRELRDNVEAIRNVLVPIAPLTPRALPVGARPSAMGTQGATPNGAKRRRRRPSFRSASSRRSSLSWDRQ